jgi:hypothetical protein
MPPVHFHTRHWQDSPKSDRAASRIIDGWSNGRGLTALTDSGHIRHTLKTPYRDGTTHVIFEPMDFVARLTAQVPSPRPPVILRRNRAGTFRRNGASESTGIPVVQA